MAHVERENRELIPTAKMAEIQRSYAEAVAKRPNGDDWLNFYSETLPGLQPDRVRDAFLAGITSRAGLRTGALHQYARFAAEPSVEISALAGRTIHIPMIEFRDTEAYQIVAQRMMGCAPQGFASFFNLKDLDVGIPTSEAARVGTVGLVVCSRIPVEGSLGLSQIRRHEENHIADPLLHCRREEEKLIISELVATIGEFAGNNLNSDAAVLNAPAQFWRGYLNEVVQKNGGSISPEFLAVLQPFHNQSELTLDVLAQAMNEYVRAATIASGNSLLTVQLMGCEDSEQLLALSRKIMPQRYKETPPKQEASPDLTQQQKQDLGFLMHYYKNWPEAYIFGKRSISSLWQQQSYGAQAMAPFVSQDRKSCMLALAVLEELTGRTFDTSHISNFEVTFTPQGDNSRCLIKW